MLRRMVKATILVVIGVGLGLGMSISTIAKNNTTKPTESKKGVVYETVYSDLTPKVQLTKHYAGGDLKNVRLSNKGKPIEARVNNERYVLGTNDNVDIDVPNVTTFFVDIRPMPLRTGHKPVVTPVGKTFIVVVPEQTNTTVNKTHSYEHPKK